MFTIRGENIYPSEIDAALNQLTNYGGEHRIVISRDAAMDELLLKFEADEATQRAGAGATAAFRDEVARKLQTVLGIRTRVEIVGPHTLTRTDFKARRVIDDREVFRGLNEQLAREGR
jgi:phenylacetate-CoA ligase